MQVKVRNPMRRRRRRSAAMPAGLVLGLAGIGLLAVVALGGPLSLLWAAGASGAAAGGTAWYQHRQGTRRFREATRKERERAERARRAQIRRERERTQNRPRPQVEPAPADGRIVTPPNCTPQCFGASKPDPENKCDCPCGGAHHNEGYRLRRERTNAKRRANSGGK